MTTKRAVVRTTVDTCGEYDSPHADPGDDFKPGDHVVILPAETWDEMVRLLREADDKWPDGMDWRDRAKLRALLATLEGKP